MSRLSMGEQLAIGSCVAFLAFATLTFGVLVGVALSAS